jgi:hypothetical protein
MRSRVFKGLALMCGWLPICKGFFSVMLSAGALMCTAFAAQMTAALMRSADRLPIMVAGFAPDEVSGFFRSGRALSITPLSPLRTR